MSEINPQTKRIAFFCSSPSWGGLEMNIVRFAHWLSESCHCVVFGLDGSPLLEKAKSHQLETVKIDKPAKYFSLGSARKLHKRLNKDHFDAIWYRYSYDLDVLSWCKVFSNRFPPIIYQQAMQLGIDKKDIYQTWKFNKIDTWISPLNFLKEEALHRTKMKANKIKVIPLAVDPKSISSEIHPIEGQFVSSEIKIGIVGRLDKMKGQHIVIEAFNQIHEAFPQTRLLIAGEPTRNDPSNYASELETLASKNKDKIHFLGYEPQPSKVYNILDILIVASKAETFGMTTIEGLTHGCIVLGTNSSGTPEILKQGELGVLFEPENAADLTLKLTSVLKALKKHREKAIQSKEEALVTYSKEKVCKEILELI